MGGVELGKALAKNAREVFRNFG